MKLPRVRFTLWWMMITVAAVAVALAADDLRRRRDRSLSLRNQHAAMERACLDRAALHNVTAAHDEAEARRLRVSGREPSDAFVLALEAQAEVERSGERQERAQARAHGTLRRKYERTARYPWLLVRPEQPDPPRAP